MLRTRRADGRGEGWQRVRVRGCQRELLLVLRGCERVACAVPSIVPEDREGHSLRVPPAAT